jgi:hypothetical protein
MKLLTMHFPPTSCYFFPLQYKYLPQHHSVTNPSDVFFIQIERLFSCPDKTMHKMVVLFILSSVSYILGLFPLSQHKAFRKLPVPLNTWSLF